MTAGSTFVGQFIDHDVTFDQTSQLGVPQNPLTSPNTLTPVLDLDSVFGGGPGMLAGLHCAHILFYNGALDQLDDLDLSGFPTAQDDQGTPYDRFL